MLAALSNRDGNMHRSTVFVHVLAGPHECQFLAENPISIGVLSRFTLADSRTDSVSVTWSLVQNSYRKNQAFGTDLVSARFRN